MALSKEIARQIREMHFGQNWTGSSLKDQLQDLDWKAATASMYSFALPPIKSEEAWQHFLSKVWQDAEEFASMIEKMPDEKMWDIMIEEKYGTYYRNFLGIIEHFHYHLGQIAILRKIQK